MTVKRSSDRAMEIPMPRTAWLLLAALALPLPAIAQSPEAVSPPRYGVAASQYRAPPSPDGGRLLVGYASNDSGRWITEFWLVSTEPTVIFVRTALDAWEGQEQIQWADSRTCSGLVPILLRANELRVPGLIIPLDDASRARSGDYPPPAPPAADGPGPWVFWAPGKGGAALDVQFSSYGGPWVEWSMSLRTALQSCWTSEPPTRLARD